MTIAFAFSSPHYTSIMTGFVSFHGGSVSENSAEITRSVFPGQGDNIFFCMLIWNKNKLLLYSMGGVYIEWVKELEFISLF